MTTTADGRHRWRFYRAGGVDQVLLESAADVLALDQLDQKLWVALSCPVKGLEFDERTLDLLDTDRDGRVRVPEILAAVAWLKAVMKDPQGLVLGTDGVPLAAINPSTPEGKSVLAAARHLLGGIGKAEADVVTVADAMQSAEAWAASRWNGDGIVPPESVDAGEARFVAENIVAALGGAPDRSGKPGVSAALLDAFFVECTAYEAWAATGETKASEVLPLGAGTATALAAVDAVRAKVDDYFTRCRLAAFDPRAQAAVNRSEEAYLDAAAKDLSVTADEVRQFPLALVEAGKALPLVTGLNPGWQAAVDALRTAAVEPLLGRGKTSLGEAEWASVQARLAGHRAWVAAKAGARVEGLGLPRVREILRGDAKAALARAIEQDLTVADAVAAGGQVEKLARLWRDLFRLLNNFVSFSDFYARRKAVFQAGTLYLDGRSTDLCVQVLDAGKHAALAAKSAAFLAYVDCSRPGGHKMSVACAITAGDSDHIFVGRNGLFYDRRGRDWDATIAKVVDNPISVGQAFWSPYKKLIRWVEDSVAKRAAAADEAANANLQSTTAGAAGAATQGAPAPKSKIDVGTVAAIGVAVSGFAAVLGALLQTFFGLGILMPLGLLALMLLISGPSMLIAWLKLRRRNLGPILDANGWAVNTLTKINIPLGRSLTDVAALPPGASRSLRDPFAPKKSVWRWLLPLLLVLGVAGWLTWKSGKLSEWLPWVPPPEEQKPELCDPPKAPPAEPAKPT
jgi:hypothetical protein